jgi:hypothetical protein
MNNDVETTRTKLHMINMKREKGNNGEDVQKIDA